jgi:hypothetical protein
VGNCIRLLKGLEYQLPPEFFSLLVKFPFKSWEKVDV